MVFKSVGIPTEVISFLRLTMVLLGYEDKKNYSNEEKNCVLGTTK